MKSLAHSTKGKPAQANPDTAHRLAGLREGADILLDPWGVAHIRAATAQDLFLAQGFNAARDRLWQIDLWRKRGLGLLAADFGPGYLEQDRAARLFLYRGDMAAEWRCYGPDAEEICTAFVAGINAYITEAEAGRAPMPPEFALMGTRPGLWQAGDVVRIRTHCLTRNVLSEVLRSIVTAESGEAADRLRCDLSPEVAPVYDPDLPPGSVPLAVLDTFKLATTPVSFTPERLAAGLEDARRWRQVDATGDVGLAFESPGSNNWAVAPSRTITGRALMASDPHRTHELPSVRYIVHLKGAGIDVIGAGEPAVPGISLGHNDRVAFSLTIFGADQEDLYVYRTRPGDPLHYGYGGGWEAMEVVEEVFAVRGAPDQWLPLKFTRHGPVLHEEDGRVFALRTVWSDPGAAPYMASLAVMRTKDHDAWREALTDWGTPSVNHLYADTDGNIAWQTVGTTPVRPNWNGLLPMPGDGRYEWAGKLTLDQLPHVRDPGCGFIATANEMNIPQGWDHAAHSIGFEWVDRSRADRLKQVLSGEERHSVPAACALQNDVLSLSSRRLLDVLSGARLGPASAPAMALLAGWDCRATADSAEAMLMELWITRHLKPALFTAAGAFSPALLWPGSIQAVLEVLENPGSPEEEEARDRLLDDTLAAAWASAGASFGTDPAGWHWKTLHRLPLNHRLARIDGADPAWSIPEMKIGGNGSTVNYANYRVSDFQAITGPSVRLVMDVGAWDNSVFVNLPGQSGLPASPHYADLAPLWENGDYCPLLYSDDAVEAAAVARIRLRPVQGPGDVNC